MNGNEPKSEQPATPNNNVIADELNKVIQKIASVSGDLPKEVLLKNYLSLREQLDTLEEKVDAAKKVFCKSLGEIEEIRMCGVKVTYKFDNEIDQEKLKNERPEIYFSTLKEPELDTTKFRKEHAELVEGYSKQSKKRPLKIVLA